MGSTLGIVLQVLGLVVQAADVAVPEVDRIVARQNAPRPVCECRCVRQVVYVRLPAKTRKP